MTLAPQTLPALRQSQDRGLSLFPLKLNDELVPLSYSIEEHSSWHEEDERDLCFAVTSCVEDFHFDVPAASFGEARFHVEELGHPVPHHPYFVRLHGAPATGKQSRLTAQLPRELAHRNAPVASAAVRSLHLSPEHSAPHSRESGRAG